MNAGHTPPPSLREVLETALAQAEAEAVTFMQDAVDAMKLGANDEIVDGHVLDATWARGEARGIRNMLVDLEEVGLLPAVLEPPPPLQLVPKLPED